MFVCLNGLLCGFGKQHWFVTLSWSQGQNQSVCEACCWTTHCNSVCLFDKNSSVWKENKQLSGLLLSLQKGAVTRAQHNIYITVYIILHTPLSFSHFLSVPLISLSLFYSLSIFCLTVARMKMNCVIWLWPVVKSTENQQDVLQMLFLIEFNFCLCRPCKVVRFMNEWRMSQFYLMNQTVCLFRIVS